jgi:hypothetical protein
MLQSTCLVRKEGEEIAPVSLRARVDIRMMRNAKVPTEVSYTPQPLRWHYYLEELESNTVLPELEGISAVQRLYGFGVNAPAGDKKRQETRSLRIVTPRCRRGPLRSRIEAFEMVAFINVIRSFADVR